MGVAVANVGSQLAVQNERRIRERIVRVILTVAGFATILTTFGIVASFAVETFAFFRQVSIIDYLTGTVWTPLFTNAQFGILPLVTATFVTAGVALAVAVPLGLVAAIYLSEFASPRMRATLKPLLELLAGVPTVVYGYFGLVALTPFLQRFIPGLGGLNMLSAGVIMGVMIIPLVSSLSEDALSSVPQSLREGGYGLGATRFEVATKIVLPAAFSGVVASVMLALSRAVGETMIVAIIAGSNPTLTFDPRRAASTMTAYIAQVSLGDVPFGSLEYLTIYAVGATLFVITFGINIVSFWVIRRFREVYE